MPLAVDATVLVVLGLAVGAAAAFVPGLDRTQAQASAGGLLLALVALDLVPDAVADGRQAGQPAAVLVPVATVVAAVGYAVLGRFARTCCAAVSGAALAGHGCAEGLLLGLGLGLAPAAAPWLAAVFALHKAAEGFALVAGLPSPRSRLAWLAVAAAAPATGAALGATVDLPEVTVPWVTVLLAGMLAAVGAHLARPALRAPGATRALPWLGAAVVVGLTAVSG